MYLQLVNFKLFLTCFICYISTVLGFYSLSSAGVLLNIKQTYQQSEWSMHIPSYILDCNMMAMKK